MTDMNSGSKQPTAAQVQAHFEHGVALHQQGQLAQANQVYRQVLEVQPGHSDALHALGIVAAQTNDLAGAADLIGRSVAINPHNAAAHNNLGNALHVLGRQRAAIDSFDQALKLDPGNAAAHMNRGNALRNLQQPHEAIESYDRAIALDAGLADAFYNRGVALGDLNQHQDAIDSLDRAITLQPGFAQSYHNRGVALGNLRQYQAAIENYDKALQLDPGYSFLMGTRLHTRMLICDWQDAEKQIAQLREKIERNEQAILPFPVLTLIDSPAVQRQATDIWINATRAEDHTLGEITKRAKRDKIRIGYFSADLRDHAIGYLTAGLFEQHDRERFDLVAFSFGPDNNDDTRKRIAAAFGRFVDISKHSDRDVAQLARSLEIDIAVDLTGLTQGNRVEIFAHRAAPLQVNYLGYPGTMAAPYMDYLIADNTLIPQSSRSHYAEKIAYLPHSYQANDAKRRIAEKTFARSELGLPDTGFVFCCFNNNFKITPRSFDGMMRILQRVPGSVLWLLEDNATAAANLRKQAAARGVDASRLVFAGRMPMEEHLARHHAADLFLDTLPYNAHTTASDALWTGLPVLTCTGEAFAARVAASLLKAIAMPELITTSEEAFEALAVELALTPDKLKQVREKLARNRLTTPLFDTARFARHIEDAYMQMYQRYHAGQAPDDIQVKPGHSA